MVFSNNKSENHKEQHDKIRTPYRHKDNNRKTVIHMVVFKQQQNGNHNGNTNGKFRKPYELSD